MLGHNNFGLDKIEKYIQLALEYYKKQKYALAHKYFELAAEQGDADAQYLLGNMYLNGQGAKQDCAKAKEYFELAAEQGNAGAQSNLGTMYSDGRGVKQDYAKAKEYFELAAEQGHASAQHNLEILKNYIEQKAVKHCKTTSKKS
jgi:TPR repeat protein